MKNFKKNIKGIILVFIIALFSNYVGKYFPNIGASGFGIIIGIILNSFFNLNKNYNSGINFSSKQILHFSIVLLGASVNLKTVIHTGITSFPVIITGIMASFLTANIFGKLLKLNFSIRNLIGAGSGICGGSAIAAVSTVINPEEKDISYSLSTIFFFNVIAVFSFPAIGNLLHMSQHSFGMFAGSAINDTSSVIAAAYIYGNEAGIYATTVKLTRTIMIIPIILIFSWIMSLKNKNKEKLKINKVFPWFITGFLIISILNTLYSIFAAYIPNNIFNAVIIGFISFLEKTGKFFIIMAITAIGLKTNFKAISNSGFKPLFLGLITWFSVIFSTLFVQIIFKL